jgi:two-component system sensor histidine kinase/response regulator
MDSPSAKQESVLDLVAALERVEGDRDLLEELAALFAEESAKNVAEIHRAFDTGDVVLLQRLAHTVKGASANLGANCVSRAAMAIEEQARDWNLSAAGKKIAALEVELAKLRPMLESLTRKVTHGIQP